MLVLTKHKTVDTESAEAHPVCVTSACVRRDVCVPVCVRSAREEHEVCGVKRTCRRRRVVWRVCVCWPNRSTSWFSEIVAFCVHCRRQEVLRRMGAYWVRAAGSGRIARVWVCVCVKWRRPPSLGDNVCWP